jgi:hypothetical protein
LHEVRQLPHVDPVGFHVGAVTPDADDELLARVLPLGVMARARQFEVDSAMKHGGDDHENDQQDENHVHERRHVDLGLGRRRLDVRFAPQMDLVPLLFLALSGGARTGDRDGA